MHVRHKNNIAGRDEKEKLDVAFTAWDGLDLGYFHNSCNDADDCGIWKSYTMILLLHFTDSFPICFVVFRIQLFYQMWFAFYFDRCAVGSDSGPLPPQLNVSLNVHTWISCIIMVLSIIFVHALCAFQFLCQLYVTMERQ